MKFSELKEKGPPENVFSADEDGMSVDWVKFAKAKETQARNGEKEEYGVVELYVKKIRTYKDEESLKVKLRVVHDPDYPNGKILINYAHSLIRGIPSKKHKDFVSTRGSLGSIRQYLSRISEWEVIIEEDYNQIIIDQISKAKTRKDQTSHNRLEFWLALSKL